VTRDEIQEEIISFIANHFELERDAVRPEARFFEDLGLDSIDAVELALHLSDVTKQNIEEATLRKIVTVSDVVDLTVELKAAGAR
jgi:acyl carrier protein